jgi:hypothetical protein
MQWVGVASMVTGAILIFNVEIAGGKVHVMSFPPAINLRI